MQKHFLDISSKVTSSFYETFSPFLKQAEEDLQRLHRQGEKTLTSWKDMMLQFKSFWNKPFILTFLPASFVGTIISFVCALFLWTNYNQEVQNYEKRLASNENMLLWYFEKYKKSSKATKKENQLINSKPKTQGPNKKTKKLISIT